MTEAKTFWLVDSGTTVAGFGGSGLKWVRFDSKLALRFESAEDAGRFIVKNKIEGAKAVKHVFLPDTDAS